MKNLNVLTEDNTRKIYVVKNKKELKQIIKEASLDANLNYLDVSHVKNMSNLFEDSKFNGDISSWDVSHVKICQICFLLVNLMEIYQTGMFQM